MGGEGKRLDKHDIRKNVCAFANGNEPGYLILGAEEGEEGWSLPGWEFPDEPPTWVSSVVGDGVLPVPRIDVRPMLGDRDDCRVAVVEVLPIATPPCFSRGTIYERVPGRSAHVREPTRLQELYRRGETAHLQARTAAAEAADSMMDDQGHPGFKPDFARFALAVNATGHPPDISSRLFSEAYERSLTTAVRDCLAPVRGNVPPAFWPQVAHGFTQSARYAISTDQLNFVHTRFWNVRVIWNGTVIVHYMTDSEPVRPFELSEGAVRDAWRAAVRLLKELGGYGPMYMELRIDGAVGRGGDPLPRVTLGRGPMDGPPNEDAFASVERELSRAAGAPAYEDPGDWVPVDARQEAEAESSEQSNGDAGS